MTDRKTNIKQLISQLVYILNNKFIDKINNKIGFFNFFVKISIKLARLVYLLNKKFS